MKRIMFSLLFLVFATVALAQSEQVYKVQKGDTLWALSGEYLDDPMRWGELLGLNPYLKEPGRMYDRVDKGVVVIIKPGEELRGLQQLGITAEPLPIEALQVSTQASAPFYRSAWFAFLAALLLAAVAYALHRASWRFRNPITSGQPIVEGGIPPESPRNVEERFQRIAERHYGEANPSANLSAERPMRVGEIESGHLSGDGVVQYRDRREPRRLRREPAYRARFRFHNGNEEELYFLQGCANDVTFSGARYVGFEWTNDQTVVPAPQPARETGPVPLRAVARSGEIVDAIPMPMTIVTVAGLRMVVPEGASVLVGEKGAITIAVSHACDITIGRTKKAKAAKTIKSATAAAS